MVNVCDGLNDEAVAGKRCPVGGEREVWEVDGLVRVAILYTPAGHLDAGVIELILNMSVCDLVESIDWDGADDWDAVAAEPVDVGVGKGCLLYTSDAADE